MPKDDPASLLREAIQLHQAHMDGTEPTSEASQQKLMRLLEDALTAITNMAASAANVTRNPRGFVLLAAEQITDEGLQWIEVMPTAEKARNGRWYFTVTTDDLETFAQSIRDQPGLIPVDYDHEGAGDGSTRAAGWFTGQARVENGVLLAEVRWTPKAVEEIRAGEYKRISPEFSFRDVDKKTGLLTRAKEILAATLTNRPFFRELAPVGTEVVWQPNGGLEQLRQKLHTALDPGPLDQAHYWVMDVTAGAALVQEYQSNRTWVVPFVTSDAGDVVPAAAAEWTEAQQEWVAAAREAARQNTGRRPFTSKETAMPNQETLKALGLADDATDEQIEEAVKASVAKTAELERENTELKATAATTEDGRVEKLEQLLTEERVRRVTGEREQVLAQAVRDGRIVPAQKDALIVAFGGEQPDDASVTALRAFVDTAPVRTNKEIGSGGEGEQEPDITNARKVYTQPGPKGNILPDEDSLKLDVAARKHLTDRGKTTFTDTEYLEAIRAVQVPA